MFVAHQREVSLDLRAAQARLINLVSQGSLNSASHDAYEDGLEQLARLGPFGEIPGLSRLVKISFVEPVYRQDAMTLGVRWEAAGVTSGLFPVFDGDITLSRVDDHTTQLALMGSYRAPLGAVGAGLDRALMSRVAEATIRALLRDVAAALTGAEATGRTSDVLRLYADPETEGQI